VTLFSRTLPAVLNPHSALEVSTTRYINRRFTYLLTCLLTYLLTSEGVGVAGMHRTEVCANFATLMLIPVISNSYFALACLDSHSYRIPVDVRKYFFLLTWSYSA